MYRHLIYAHFLFHRSSLGCYRNLPENYHLKAYVLTMMTKMVIMMMMMMQMMMMMMQMMMMMTMLFAVQAAALSFARAFCLHLSFAFTMMMMTTTMMIDDDDDDDVYDDDDGYFDDSERDLNVVRYWLKIPRWLSTEESSNMFCQLHFHCHCLS